VNQTAFHRDDNRAVRWWLCVIAFLVALMVLVGGATRLTDSGLSITEWEPITGIIPPITHEAWMVEFEKYRQTTEYQTVNRGMTLLQFEFIFWWEWAHRFLGRLLGFAVLVPLVVFWMRGHLAPWLKPRLLVLLLSIGLQGAIGWWMVVSGLVGRTDVSQIRLAVHLTMACAIFIYTLWLAFGLRSPRDRPAASLAPWAMGLTALVLVQVFAGGLVAGLDAGMAYNTWPLMLGSLVPDGLWAIDPAWRNLVDNALTVQFIHRLTAYLLWGAALFHAIQVQRVAPVHAARVWAIFALISVQALLGIATLLMQVPLGWALAHQFGAVLVLLAVTLHWRALRGPHAVAEPVSETDLGALHDAA
jgi:cytochrome c oxidase assembly protein subunit 15